MSQPTPRPTRSRISSPFVAAPANATQNPPKIMADGDDKPKTFLDKWVEPPLPTPRPSFAEAGIERHGVVANMAPLGTRPSSKVLKSMARPEGMDGGGRTATVKKSAASSVSTPGESMVTPEPTTAPSRRRSVSTKAEDLEYNPKTPQQQMSARKSISRSSIGGQASGQGVFALQQSPIVNTHPTPPRPVAVAPVLPAPPVGPDGEQEINLEQTDRVVESAVQEALDHRRWPTAYALRTLYDDHRTNKRMVRLIEAVYGQRANDAQRTEFVTIMKHKKKEGKKDRTGEYYFNGDGSDPPPRQPQFSAVNSASYNTPSGRPSTGARSMSDTQARRSSINHSSVSASPHKEHDHAHVSKKHRGNNFQPSNMELNGNASVNGMSQQQQPPQQNGSSSSNNNNMMNRGRSDSMSSSSSLSSIDEQILGGDFSSGDISSSMHGTGSSHAAAGSGVDSARGGGGGGGGVMSGRGGHGHFGFGSLGPGFGAAGNAPTRFVSPYASANNFAASAETLVGLGARNQNQPITRQNIAGPKTYTFSTTGSSTSSPAAALSSSSSTNNNTTHAVASAAQYNNHNTTTTTTTTDSNSNDHQLAPSSTTANNSMAPSAIYIPSSNSESSQQQQQPSFKAKNLNKVQGRPYDENDVSSRMKRTAREKTEKGGNISESFERHQVSTPVPQEIESASDGGDSIAVTASKRPTKVRLLNRDAKQRYNYDSEDLSSPTLLEFKPDLAPGSLSTSRAGTPNNFNRPTRKAKPGTGLRVKTSPMKKKGGTLAGIPRASGERNSPVGNGASSHNQDDNDDYCSSCGGNGDLVCCDGCTRSFHFRCVDPPIIEGSLPDEWFCNACLTARLPRGKEEENGTFGYLLANLERKNPSAFHLPKAIREYFVDVKTGTEGEYEEGGAQKTKNRAGYDEAPDYFRLKDGKGKTILCHECHGTASAPDRAIIPCTYCGLYWHLDCLPTPMAKEPPPGKPWRCPAHVDDLLAEIPGSLGPAHRFRKIKGASVIKPAISRGIKNNGHIEIENMPSDDDEEQGFYEQREYGHVYKLPEQGIKLDFISQVRQKTGGRGGYAPPAGLISRMKSPRNPNGWATRTLLEQQAALNLASLVSQNPDMAPSNALLETLLAEAPNAVVAMVAQGNAENIMESKLTSKDKHSLVALKALIESKLSAIPDDDTEPSANNESLPNNEEEETTRTKQEEQDDVEMLL